ncbi:MAG: L-aspartate oxidase [Mycobacteriales bacterium]
MIPRRLSAPAPGWTLSADVVVVGSGVAGLCAALAARACGARVLLVTKARLDAGSTRWAQGGIAAALGPGDTPEQHLRDTLDAGAGLCDPEAVAVLVREGPGRIQALVDLGAAFDRADAGELALTREGGHRRNRVAHAGGDATGAEVSRALIAAVRGAQDIDIVEHALVLDLLTGPGREVAGLTLHVLEEGTRDGVGAVHARGVVLATGGLGQVFSSTTNPPVSTGDGVALALRAGAEVADCEFVQFHPTTLWLGPRARGQQPLVSEAMRGEGAVLVDESGERVMAGRHPMEDLAPRDVVARAMSEVMAARGTDHLYLDARSIGATVLAKRFPTILANCHRAGVDPAREPIPVAPAAHYASGGVRTDLWGRSSVPGLFACGEVACTGVHGANRLASNSLLEGLVFAHRIGEALAGGLPAPVRAEADQRAAGLVGAAARGEITRAMTDGAGVRRSAESLAATAKCLDAASTTVGAPGPDSWETTNLFTVATALVAAARTREESRGCHWREDFPSPRESWRRHLVTRLSGDQVLVTG